MSLVYTTCTCNIHCSVQCTRIIYLYIYIYIYRYIIYGMRRQNGHINTEYADTKIRPTILCQPPTLIYELLYVREIIGI